MDDGGGNEVKENWEEGILLTGIAEESSAAEFGMDNFRAEVKEEDDEDGARCDPRITWLENRVQNALKHVKGEKLRSSFRTDENSRAIKEFLSSPEARCLLVFGDATEFTCETPKELPVEGKSLYFLKSSTVEIESSATMDADVLFGELSQEPLIHLEKTIQHVYMPLLNANPANDSWGDIANKEIVDKLHSFLASVSITLGQTVGETCLPLPIAESSSTSNSKEKIHLLEGAVITWTKQIKHVLRLDPETQLKAGENPTPEQEVSFWRNKAAHLNSIYNQLQSDRIKKVIKQLDTSKSTYCNPFAKLCKEVVATRLEANDNVRFLATLEPWFGKLNDPNAEFSELHKLFRPIMHIILLVWKNSKYYNTPSRLVILIREISNSLISQSCAFVSGKEIFRMIEDNVADEAVEKLKAMLKVCGTFKSTYFDYKAIANTECPNNPWRIQNNALFLRIDSFLERCHDILDLTQTILQFNLLSRIEIGGTKGKALTTSVVQIYSDFCQAVEGFQRVKYDILDVNAKDFDDDFYDFRCKVKELERRLGSIMTQSFDDAVTINARFKLLDSFEGILERPIIQDELEKKHLLLVQTFAQDLKLVQETFIELRDNPPIANNLPPITGTILWCKGLIDRVSEPMEKLKTLNRSILEREEARDVMKTYDSVKQTLDDFCAAKASEWAATVDETATAKLKLPLLRYRSLDALEKDIRGETNAFEQLKAHQKEILEHGGFFYQLLEVNFDPELVALLREVKYFLLYNLEVPGFALELNKKEKLFRNWRGKLHLCVNKYNAMMTSILPVECPLVRTQVEKIHNVVQTGLSMLTWKSHGIDNFIEKTEMAVADAELMLNALKSNLANIEEILESWSETSLLDRQSKPETVKEYNQLHQSRIALKFQNMTEGSKQIHKMLKDSNKTLKISAGHPEWRAYVDYVNNVVVHGLVKVVRVSLDWLDQQIDPEVILREEKAPLLQVCINLNNNQVSFLPSIFEEDRSGVKSSLHSWINDTFKVGAFMKRLDLNEGTYEKELQEDAEVKSFMDSIAKNVSKNESKCKVFQEQYEKYAFLWTTELQKMFANFIESSTSLTSSGMCRIDLVKFDAEMKRLNDIKEEVASLKTPTNIGWLKIDSTPIKENIVYWVQKWLHLYTGYLRDDVIKKLQNLHIFIQNTRRGLQREVKAGDTETLMMVMGNIRDVRRRMDDTIEMLQPLKDTVNLLKQHRIDLEDEVLKGDSNSSEESLLEFLDSASLKWDSLVNFTFRVKEQIMPLQNLEVDSINASLQKFKTQVEEFRAQFKDEHKGAPFSFRGTPDEAFDLISKFRTIHMEKLKRAKELNVLGDLFELQPSKYRLLSQTETELDVLKKLWDFKAKQISTYEEWNNIPWKTIDTDRLQEINMNLIEELKTLGVKDSICRGWRVYEDIEQACKDMEIVLPLITELHSPAMRARHWKAIAAACRVPSISWNSESFTFSSLLQLELQNHAHDVSEQVETAVKELKIERKLESIESRWETLRLDFVDQAGSPAPASGEEFLKDSIENRPEILAPEKVFLPRPSDDVVENLEADQTDLQAMMGMGKFIMYFKDRVSKWSHTLSDIETNLKDWLALSKQWSSLVFIYLGSADIRSRLPEDTKRFEAIDQEFRALEGRSFRESPLVVYRCTEEGLSASLKRMLSELARCQKSLNEYLETKKKIYPRFYFVSNSALLDILSKGTSPKRIIPYLADCYSALSDLVFRDKDIEDPKIATHMVAKDGETVKFAYNFEMSGNIEDWLNRLTDMQVLSLKTILRAAVDAAVHWDHEKPRHEWLFDYPAQSVLQASQIFWTEETEAALEDFESGNEEALKFYLSKCNARLARLISLVEGNLREADRVKIISLITMDVHARDVVQRLISDKAEGPTCFLWQQQLRYYWKTVNPQMETEIQICDFKTRSSYEYVGNSSRLVITPLTDRCYITLTTAMRLVRGGAPAGPAGTGKTETTKDLAKALALPCYVFNCSSQMNISTLADIFKGLSQTGGWGCFDEFNRIQVEVLSVVSTQVRTILDAIVRFQDPRNRPEELVAKNGELGQIYGAPPCKVGFFDFFGEILCLVPTTGFFVTMNPGYAGRTELPENLKALFRTCAMIRPDLALICENMLMAEGFQQARALSVKFVTLYQLSSELLSPQAHYDWGLRAVKAVLRVAGAIKRTSTGIEEGALLMRALRDFNTPKIPNHDLPVFLRLVKDLFPEYAEKTPKLLNETLKETVHLVCMDACPPLQADENFAQKVLQLQELMDVHHSVMLLGCAGSGKTTIWKTLQSCLNHVSGMDKKVAVSETINPKALTSDELYGFMNLSRDWKDGVLSIIMRGMSKNIRDLGYHAHQTNKWVVLDGDIDAGWIESMNTVMDDNRVLTLVSNERIPLDTSMRMVFEINSLRNATPATVSRAGILYINEGDIGWRPFVESWVSSRDEAAILKEVLPSLFDRFVEKVLEFMKRKQLKFIVPTYTLSCVQTLCSLLESLISQLFDTTESEILSHGKYQVILEQLFVFSTIWAFGSGLVDQRNCTARKIFSNELLREFPGLVPVDDGNTVFDYFVDIEAAIKPQQQHEESWRLWSSKAEEFVVPSIIGSGPGQTPFSALFVDTVANVSGREIIGALVLRDKPVLLAGGAGTGKSVMMRNWISQLLQSDEGMLSCQISMNFFTDAHRVQNQIEDVIEKRSGKRFGPPGNKKLLFFVDDLNLPYIEEFGTQNAISLLRQILSHGNMFDRTDLSLRKEIVDVRFVAAMNPFAGSFRICERAQRHFTTLACSIPDEDSLSSIFLSVLEGHLQSFSADIEALLSPLVQATIALHARMSEKFLPSATKFAYNWNMREFAGIFEGICRSSPEEFESPMTMCRLWVHECQRVFRDRLIGDTDITRFDDMILDVSKTFGLEDLEELHLEPLIFTNFHGIGAGKTTASGESSQSSSATSITAKPILPYKDLQSFPQLTRLLNAKLKEYNEVNPEMDLVLFSDAVKHVTRISRIIQCTGGCAMLVGIGGSGKQSLSRLAAFIHGFEVVQMQSDPDFNVDMLLTQLQEMVKSTGVRGVPTMWLVNDGHILREEFLVYINDIVVNGWIPELFPRDEIETILDGLKGELRANGLSNTHQEKMALLIRRIKQNLHVVLCFSPAGETLRLRARRFPGLINCSTIDWFHPWPEEALVGVALNSIKDVEFANQETRENIAYHMATVHQEVIKSSCRFEKIVHRFNHVTPRSFLEFIALYRKLLQEQRIHAHEQVERLQSGLEVLRKTSMNVKELKEDLNVTLANVEEKKVASEILMEQIGVQRADAEKKHESAAREQSRAEEATRVAKEIQETADKELAEASPAMEAAKAAVNCLDKKALTELKSLTKPPAGVDQVTKACLMMIEGEFKNFKWERAKKMMSNTDHFLVALKAFDAEYMDENLILKLEPIVNLPVFNYEQMVRKSFAAANLCNWVSNIFKYNRIYVKVKPLMDKLEEARRDKADAEAELAEVQRVVGEVEARLDELKRTFLQATQEKMAVEETARACKEKLDLANRLVNGLASENNRWAEEVEKLRKKERDLVGNVLLSSAFVGYIGGFDMKFRENLWQEEWLRDLMQREIPCGGAGSVDPLELLLSSSQRIQMMDEGLPADRKSLENGAIICSCTRWPLLIDPQEQGLRWLKSKYVRFYESIVNEEQSEAEDEMEQEEETPMTARLARRSTTKSLIDLDAGAKKKRSHTQREFPISVQLSKSAWEDDVVFAIEHGHVLFIENIGEEIDASLNSVLARATTRKGRNRFIRFGGREVEYDERFRLFLFTKLSNPHFKPELQAQCSLINFIATEQGLEDQLLERVVRAERPDKEAQQEKLQNDFNKYKMKLTELEDALLEKLSEAPEDILADIQLIQSLEATKAEAEKINEAVSSGEKLLEEINKIRDVYRPVATEAAMLYFMLSQLSSVNHMYQYSLTTFIYFFNKSIKDTPQNGSNEGVSGTKVDANANSALHEEKTVLNRVEGIQNTLRFTVYTYVSRSLFERHKQLFLAQLMFNLMQRNLLPCSSDWSENVFEFLVRLPKDDFGENPLDEWLPDSSWQAVQKLAEIEEFSKLPNDMIEAGPRFKDWFTHSAPEIEKLPLDWAQLDKTEFLKLPVIRCLRPDRMTAAVTNFIKHNLPNGKRFLDCDSTLNSFDLLSEAFADSSPETPIYFILCPGVDVLNDLDKLASAKGLEKGKTYHSLSMGQGQDVLAERLLRRASNGGHWVVLANVHLVPKWLGRLEKLLDQFKTQGLHDGFRLYLSSDPSTLIPIGILSRCIKLTNEAPSGLNANLKRSVLSLSREHIEESEAKTKAILFGLCWFHTIISERRKFGPMGFNLKYPFSLGDLRDSATCLRNYMDNPNIAGPPWQDLRYIFGEIIYGGHIVNDFDRRLTNAYLKTIMRDELLEEMELFPFSQDTNASFKSPPPTLVDRYLEHIEENLRHDSPLAFGMHPNAEVEFRTAQSNELFLLLDELRPTGRRDDLIRPTDLSPQHTAENLSNEILDRFSDSLFDIQLLEESLDSKGPFQHVFIQECEALNVLLKEMRQSLQELTLAFAGELIMSTHIHSLVKALDAGMVPDSWLRLAWPSTRSLTLWLSDLSNRIVQLTSWTANPTEIPRVTWLSGLVYPTAFLTALKQTRSQRTGVALDMQEIFTEVSKRTMEECLEEPPREGLYIHGFYMQGARWNQSVAHIEDCIPNELFCEMPVINCKAVIADQAKSRQYFICPCYKTLQRGQTFVFSAQLRTKAPASKWILAGVALIMDIET